MDSKKGSKFEIFRRDAAEISNKKMPYQYSNVEIKILPNGRKTVRKVYVKNGKGYKIVTKYRRGRKTSSVKKPIHVDHIDQIKKCQFVPGLFAECIDTKMP